MVYPARGAWLTRNVTEGFTFTPTLDSILISQEMPDLVAAYNCRAVDQGDGWTFSVEDEVRVTFAGGRIFAGHLKSVTEDRLEETGARCWDLEAQDFTAKLGDALIRRRKKRKRENARRRVRWILRALGRHGVWTLADQDLSNVPTDEDMEPYDYFGASVDEAVAHVAEELRMHHFVDLDNAFQMIRNEAVTAPFDLDNEAPDLVDTFPFREWRNTSDSVELANAVLVEPEKRKHSRWVKDATSIDDYERQERFISDSNIHRPTQATKLGNRTLNEVKDPDVEGRLFTYEPGLQAGMKVHVREQLWDHDYDRYIRGVDIRAVDPHDGSGEAHLKTTATIARSWKKRRKPDRHGINRVARRRPGQTTDTDPWPLDRFSRVVAPATMVAGAAIGTALNTFRARRGYSLWEVDQGFAWVSNPSVKYVVSYVGEWYHTLASGPPWYVARVTFRGWVEWETWWSFVMPAHPASMAGVEVTLTTFGLDRSGVTGERGLDVVVATSAPTDTRQGTLVGHLPADAAPHALVIPGTLIPAAGQTLWVGVQAGWTAQLGTFVVHPWQWPYWSGANDSGRCQVTLDARGWMTWSVTGDSMGAADAPDGAPYEGGWAWREAGVEGSPTYEVDGSAYVVSDGGRGIYLVGEREDEDEPDGPWSDVSWSCEMDFKVDASGDTGEAGPCHIELTTIGEGERTIGTVHLGDSGHAEGISVKAPGDEDYVAKTIGVGELWRARFDSRSNRLRGKLWNAAAGEPAAWDVEVAMAQTEDDADRFLLWVRAGAYVGAPTVRIEALRYAADGGDGKRVVREWVGHADGLGGAFTTCHPYREGSLAVLVNGADVRPSSEDGDEAIFGLDYFPTAGSVLRATYIIDQGE